MSIDYIRVMYKVPAKVGGRVKYTGGPEPKFGTITSATGRGHLNIRLDGQKHALPYHPKWELEYLDDKEPPHG